MFCSFASLFWTVCGVVFPHVLLLFAAMEVRPYMRLQGWAKSKHAWRTVGHTLACCGCAQTVQLVHTSLAQA